MDAAPAPPTVLDLPPAFAAALDSPAGLRVRDPRTGARFRLVPAPPREPDGDHGDGPVDGYRSGKTLEESVRAGLAQADAGLGMTTEEVRAEMARRHPELRGR